jgi:hypothetical protein
LLEAHTLYSPETEVVILLNCIISDGEALSDFDAMIKVSPTSAMFYNNRRLAFLSVVQLFKFKPHA